MHFMHMCSCTCVWISSIMYSALRVLPYILLWQNIRTVFMFIFRISSYKRSTSKKTCYNYKLLTTYHGNILCFDDNCMSSFAWYCAYVATNINHWCESMYTNSKHTGYYYQQCLTNLYCENQLYPTLQIVACCPDSTRPLFVTMCSSDMNLPNTVKLAWIDFYDWSCVFHSIERTI